MNKVVTKVELVAAIANKTNQPKAEVERFMEAAQSTITEFLEKGQDVPVLGLGRLKKGSRKARSQVTPKGDRIEIPARNVVKFSPAKKLKEVVNA